MAASNCEKQCENEEEGGSEGGLGRLILSIVSSPHYWYVVSDFFESIHILPQERSSWEVSQPLWKKKEIPIPILSKVSIPKSAHILLTVVNTPWLRYWGSTVLK